MSVLVMPMPRNRHPQGMIHVLLNNDLNNYSLYCYGR